MRNLLSQYGKKKMNTLRKWRVTKDCSGISQGLVEYIIRFEGFQWYVLKQACKANSSKSATR